MNKVKNGILAILLGLVISTSCTKDNLEQVNDQSLFTNLPDSVTVNVDNGRLVFDSEESLQTCINYLSAIGDDKFDEFESALGYTSFRTANDALPENVDDELFATLMNDQQQIEVAGYLLTTNLENETTTIKPIGNALKARVIS